MTTPTIPDSTTYKEHPCTEGARVLRGHAWVLEIVLEAALQLPKTEGSRKEDAGDPGAAWQRMNSAESGVQKLRTSPRTRITAFRSLNVGDSSRTSHEHGCPPLTPQLGRQQG